jgi:hypothetical protein
VIRYALSARHQASPRITGFIAESLHHHYVFATIYATRRPQRITAIHIAIDNAACNCAGAGATAPFFQMAPTCDRTIDAGVIIAALIPVLMISPGLSRPV